MLACAEGSARKWVAAELRTTEHNVARWRGRFVRHRLDGLHDEQRPGRPPSILLDKVEEVVTATLEELPGEPHLVDGFKLSTDPLFIGKVVDVIGLCHNPPEKAVVLCVDKKSGIQALDRSQPVLPMMPGMPERRTHDYDRNGVTSLFAAFNVAMAP